MIKIYVSPSCLSSRKVMLFFDEEGIPYVKRNIIHCPLNDFEIKTLIYHAPNGISDIISTRSKYIRNNNIKIDELSMDEIFELIKIAPTIIKRPIIFQDNEKRKLVQIGYNSDQIDLFKRIHENYKSKESIDFF